VPWWRSLSSAAFTRSAAPNFNFMENLIGGIVSVLLFIYLVFAMLRPEKF
jgi:K+-transporting ATPase KdpF subunit